VKKVGEYEKISYNVDIKNGLYIFSDYIMIFTLLIILIFPISIITLLVFIAKKETKSMSDEIEKNNPLDSSQTIEEKRNPAFHIFLYLLLFSSLGFVLQGIISVYYQLIEKAIKPSSIDEIKGCIETNFSPSDLKFGIATLLISFLIYHALSLFINRKLIKGDIRQESLVRKFTTYLAMFILAAMTIGGVVNLLLSYFEGELSLKSFAKIGVFITFSVAFLCFYLWEIRRRDISGKTFNILMIISLILSLSALVIGFVISDSPKVAREKKIDDAIIENIKDTSDDISDFVNKENEKLPKQEDFKTREGVAYKTIDEKSFELCGNFKQQATEIEYDSYNAEYRHSAGGKCFKYDMKCEKNDSNDVADKCSVEIEKSNDNKNRCGGFGGSGMF